MKSLCVSFQSFIIAACCILAGGAPSHAESASPLLFHATFDDTLEAQCDGGRIMPTVTEGKIEYRAGKVGEALLVGGDGALLKYPIAGNLRTTQGSIEMWVQPVDWPAEEKAFHVFFETEGPGWLLLYKFSTGGVLALSGMDKTHYGSAWDTQLNLQNGRWYHLAVTWQKSELALYIDGVKKQNLPLPPLPEKLAGNFILGDAPWSTPSAAHTLIDEVKIYRYALPPEQIARLAKGETAQYSPGLSLTIEPHPALNRWNVQVDAGAYVSEGDKSSAIVKITKADSNASLATSRIEKFADGIGVAAMDISKLAPGDYTVHARVLAASGKELANNSIAFAKPPNAPWTNNRVGMQDKVLPPFTALKVGANQSVECWNRKYTLGAPFPTQIESAGQAMLAAPMRLVLTSANGEEAFGNQISKITSSSPTRAIASGSASTPDFTLTTQSSIEYDGMMWTDMTLKPKTIATINELTLHIPLRTEQATLFHHSSPSWSLDDAGIIPAAGYETNGVQHFMWLGNEDRGLAWFCETQQGWSNAPGKILQRIVRHGDVTELQIQFVNQPTKINAALHISFGLQATPVKPLPAAARGRRLTANLGDTDDLKLGPKNSGNIQILWSTNNLSHFGYPAPADAVKFRKKVADLHAHNIKVVPYINLNFLQTETPEWKYYSPDFVDPARSFVGGDVGAMGSALLGACPHSAAWRDLIAYKIAKFVDEYGVDGIYVDCWSAYGCLVESHGCGWRDANGDLKSRYPLRDYREIMRRVREIFADRKPDFFIIAHMSSGVWIPTFSFADAMLDGEQYQGDRAPKDDYLGVVPLDKWRTENNGAAWGVQPFFLPEFTGENRLQTVPTQRLMAIMLAHDISPWPIWSNAQVVFDAWKTADKFGIADSQFLPYWKQSAIISDSKEVVVSAYHKTGRTLLVIFNTGRTDATTKLSIDAKRLGVKGNFSAKNLADDSAITATGNQLEVAIPARNYRLIEIQ